MQQLRSMIRVALQQCDTVATPNFCEMLHSSEGYRRAESMVLNFALKNKVSIGAAIGHLETEMV